VREVTHVAYPQPVEHGVGIAHAKTGLGPRLSWALRWATPVALLVAATVVAMMTEPSVPLVVAGAVALVTAAWLLGWRRGEERRIELQGEIESRSRDLRRALTELEIAQAETVRRLSMAVEFRDEDTGAHIERIGRFSTLLAEQVEMDTEFCTILSHAAPLHDVGKVAIPDSILLKPGPLTDEERLIVETHAEEGYRLLRGSSSSILDLAATIALSHHEKWDGTGYPRGIAAEAIPIEGRIVAIADVFDALTSDRVYRKAFPLEKAVAMMREQRGQHFDPVLLDAFLEVLGSSGPDARAKHKADPESLVAGALESYTTALERGDAEAAEAVFAQAIDDGISPSTLHCEVFAPAMIRLGELAEAGEIDLDTERLATGITRRILATMYRYTLAGSDQDREPILIAGVEGEDRLLVLQMLHDQLAAAGYQTTLDSDFSSERLDVSIESHSPELMVLAATRPSSIAELDRLLNDLRERHGGVPVVLAGPVVGELSNALPGVRTLERIDQVVPAVHELFGVPEHALS
jgi:methanogenic corrinoid protein MtbC1